MNRARHLESKMKLYVFYFRKCPLLYNDIILCPVYNFGILTICYTIFKVALSLQLNENVM